MEFLIALIMSIGSSNLGIDSQTLPRNELFCLSKAVYHEARGEPVMGQVAVAHVILNRVDSPRFPDTICEVIHKPKHFTDIEKCNPDFNSKAWRESVTSAVHVYLDLVEDPTHGAKWYFAPKGMKNKTKKPWWAKYKTQVASIGGHRFYNQP